MNERGQERERRHTGLNVVKRRVLPCRRMACPESLSSASVNVVESPRLRHPRHRRRQCDQVVSDGRSVGSISPAATLRCATMEVRAWRSGSAAGAGRRRQCGGKGGASVDGWNGRAEERAAAICYFRRGAVDRGRRLSA